jgi:hypothetical protein
MCMEVLGSQIIGLDPGDGLGVGLGEGEGEGED